MITRTLELNLIPVIRSVEICDNVFVVKFYFNGNNGYVSSQDLETFRISFDQVCEVGNDLLEIEIPIDNVEKTLDINSLSSYLANRMHCYF